MNIQKPVPDQTPRRIQIAASDNVAVVVNALGLPAGVRPIMAVRPGGRRGFRAPAKSGEQRRRPAKSAGTREAPESRGTREDL